MSFLPIVHRELSQSAARARTYWTRFCAAAVMSVILFAMLSGRGSSVVNGGQAFKFLSVIALGYCLLAGVLYTSDAISRERREGTLGLLFLTNLKGYDVCIGKLAATSLDAVFVLLSICPLLGIPVVMGGVTGTEFWRVVLLLVNTLFFSLTLGLFVSVWGIQERRVIISTVLLLLVVTFGLPLLRDGLSRSLAPGWLDWVLLFPSPVYVFRHSTPGLSRADFWPSMSVIFGISVLLSWLASVVLPRIYQETDLFRAVPWRRGANAARETPEVSEVDSRRALGRDQLGVNPFLWLMNRDRGGKILLSVLAVVAGLFAIWTATLSPRMRLMGVAFFGAIGFQLMIKFLVAVEGCRRFNEDKASGALELLLCSPLKVDSMLRAQDARLFRLFLPPIIMVAMINLGIAWAIRDSTGGPPVIRGGITVFVDCWVLAQAAMWNGLEANGIARAVFISLGRVIMPSWILIFLFVIYARGSSVSVASGEGSIWLWFLFVLVYDFWLGTHYRRKLHASFRAVAAGESVEDREDWSPMNWE